jgi:hypothetical protein
MAFEDRWTHEFRIGTGLKLFAVALVIGVLLVGLQLFHHYIGLPQWFVDGWVRR